MSDFAHDNEQGNALAASHLEFSDFNFEADSDDDFHGRAETFRSDFSDGGQEFDLSGTPRSGSRNYDDDILDAEIGDAGPVDTDVPTELKIYLEKIARWKGEGGRPGQSQEQRKREFVNDGNAIDELREERLRYAREFPRSQSRSFTGAWRRCEISAGRPELYFKIGCIVAGL